LEKEAFNSTAARVKNLKESRRYDEAEEEIRRALEREPDQPHFKLSLADLYLRQGKVTESRVLVEEVLIQNPQHPQALCVLGDIFFKQRSYREAFECYQQAFNRDPRSYLTLKIARAFKEMGKHEEALQELEKVLIVKPESLSFLREKAFLLNRIKRYDRALEVFEKVKKISPDDPFIQKEILRLRSRTRPDDQVLRELQKVIGMDSMKGDAQMHGLLAQKLKGAGQVREAEAEYRTAARLAPDNLYFVKQQGFCLYELERYQEASRSLSEVFRSDPTDYYVRSALEKSFEALSDLKGLLNLYEETFRLHPGQKFLLGKIKKIRKQLGQTV
jgi:tetratricopeptide (TPR) repeat protein